MAADPAAGRLVRPFKHALKAASSFYVVHPPEAICQRKVRIFRDSLFQRSISSSQSRRLAGSVRILASSEMSERVRTSALLALAGTQQARSRRLLIDCSTEL